MAIPSSEVLKARLLRRRKIDERTGCWLWIGSKRSHKLPAFRYGEIRFDDRLWLVHRVAAHVFKGFALTSKRHVLHHCDTPLCFNPKHLFDGTHRDNMDDKVAKRRQMFGERSNRTHLKIADVRAIRVRRKRGETCESIARDFKLTRGAVSRIARGKRWPFTLTRSS